jgi:hypothetical protein
MFNVSIMALGSDVSTVVQNNKNTPNLKFADNATNADTISSRYW